MKCIGPEGRVGKLKPYVANIAINIWERNLLKLQAQNNFKTSLNNVARCDTFLEKVLGEIIKENHSLYRLSNSRTKWNWLSKFGVRITAINPSVLPLKLLTNKPAWVEKWSLS